MKKLMTTETKTIFVQSLFKRITATIPKLIFGIFFFILSALCSCKKELSATSTTSALENFISSDTSLSIFYSAVQRANESQLFSRTDSLTVLAPTNSAFLSLGITSSVINSLPVSTVDSMVLYCVLNSGVSSISSAANSLSTLLGAVVYAKTDGFYDYFNGSQGTIQPLASSTATLFKLNGVLQVPFISLSQLFAADNNLSLFAEAAQRVNLTSLLSSGWNTILMPDNNAFANAGYPDIASIDNADVNTLTNIIMYHILSGQYFTSDFSGQSVVTAEGGGISLSSANGLIQFTGGSNSSAANILNPNLIAGNVIVQKIDEVLIP